MAWLSQEGERNPEDELVLDHNLARNEPGKG